MAKAISMREKKEKLDTVTIYIMGQGYKVPSSLTIMKAMEYAGFKLKRGVGCRAGFCGACATVYRKLGDYKIYANLACQTKVEDGMYLTQLPFVPANKAEYNLDEIKPSASTMLRFYPEIARCLSCNACSRVCPQDIQVMDYVQYSLQGQIEKAAELAFDCIQCGLCAIRCPAEIPQYHVATLARRLHGKYHMIAPDTLEQRVKEIEEGKYEKGFEELMSLSEEELKKRYVARDFIDQKKA
ncbi:MAG: 4Fe-4S dicluster domain-containing protein [Candidatus Heimdallarchaeum aukensis]|uniref:4Fe-4S dicluster domain-containing protein n=1 Tax=Candidatus Heimdallarchaeum aukensis TaxID=2876573 RepID=A0A9Y1BK63_9ARCH|nr:MAG: 4Fe-4S dicluster domain-containing protein [Candidatus Heimdallarchaeum aukensis]